MRLQAIQPDDAFDAEDGRRVLLVGQEVVVVSAAAAVLLDSVADGPTDLEDAATRLVEVFGAPPPPGDAVEMTGEIARYLADRRILIVTGR